MLEEENPLVGYWKVEGGLCEDANVQWSDWEGMVRGIFSICTGMQGGSSIALLFPEGDQWEREEVQNQEVVCTKSQMPLTLKINLSLERRIPGYFISAWNYLRNLVFQIGPTSYCQLRGIEDRENGHIFPNEEKWSLCFLVELWL